MKEIYETVKMPKGLIALLKGAMGNESTSGRLRNAFEVSAIPGTEGAPNSSLKWYICATDTKSAIRVHISGVDLLRMEIPSEAATYRVAVKLADGRTILSQGPDKFPSIPDMLDKYSKSPQLGTMEWETNTSRFVLFGKYACIDPELLPKVGGLWTGSIHALTEPHIHQRPTDLTSHLYLLALAEGSTYDNMIDIGLAFRVDYAICGMGTTGISVGRPEGSDE